MGHRGVGEPVGTGDNQAPAPRSPEAEVDVRQTRVALHFRDADPPWLPGTSHQVDWPENRYFKGFQDSLRHVVAASDGGNPHRIRRLVEHMLAVHNGEQPYDATLAQTYPFDPWRALKDVHGALWDSLNFIRETVFEQVRANEFPELPSRTRGIWLIPEDPESIRYWWGALNGSRILKVTAQGDFHEGHDQWLQSDTFSLAEWRDRARSYWKGEGAGQNDVEWVFVGEITIEAELDPRTFGLKLED